MKIDFEELLQEFPSKETINIITKSLFQTPEQINSLWLIARGNQKISWRAAWIMDKVYDLNPELIRPYISEMIELTPHINRDGQLRQFLKLISIEQLPSKAINGDFLDACFKWLDSEHKPVAIRVYAMQILYNLSLTEPDIINEIICTIEANMDRGSAGFKSRGNKILKQLYPKNISNK